VAKHILRYGLKYVSNSDVKLQGYRNSDWVGSTNDRKSTSRVCFSLFSAMISWMSTMQITIALNIAKAEYITTSEACT